jgi:hypothetical protein
MLVAPLCLGVLPTQAVWTDAQAEAYTKAGNDLHAASHSHSSGGGHSQGSQADAAALEAAKKAYEAQRAKLEAAQSRGGWLKWGLRILGAAICAAGVWGYWKAKQ